MGLLICSGQSLIDPADEVTFADISDEQRQAVGGLVKHAFAEIVLWQLAIIDKVGLRTSAGRFSIAAFKVPQGSKPWARRRPTERGLHMISTRVWPWAS